eukprot:3717702-Rhodomonas_salina.2
MSMFLGSPRSSIGCVSTRHSIAQALDATGGLPFGQRFTQSRHKPAGGARYVRSGCLALAALAVSGPGFAYIARSRTNLGRHQPRWQWPSRAVASCARGSGSTERCVSTKHRAAGALGDSRADLLLCPHELWGVR